MELTESLCERMKDYTRAKDKETGEPTLLRIISPEGGMNPKFSQVDIVPDEDLNKSIKFYVRFYSLRRR